MLLELTTADLLVIAGRVHVLGVGPVLLRGLIDLRELNFARRLNVVTLNHVLLVAVDEQASASAGLKPALLLFKVDAPEPIQVQGLAVRSFQGLLVLNFCVGRGVVLCEVGCLIVGKLGCLTLSVKLGLARDEVTIGRAPVRVLVVVVVVIIELWPVQALVEFLDCALARTVWVEAKAILVAHIHLFGRLECSPSIGQHVGAVLVNRRRCEVALRVGMRRVPATVHHDHGQVVLLLRVVGLHQHLLALCALGVVVLWTIALSAILRHFLLLHITLRLLHRRIYLGGRRVGRQATPLLLSRRLLARTDCLQAGGLQVADLLGVERVRMSFLARVKGRLLVFTEFGGALGLLFAILGERQRLGVLADEGEPERGLAAGRLCSGLAVRRGLGLGGWRLRRWVSRGFAF